MSVLERILERKRAEVAELKRVPGAASLERLATQAPAVRSFGGALRAGPSPRVSAEFKRASPSRGVIRADADAGAYARAYARAGAAALSVLTDAEFFDGSFEDLRTARAACELPVLRKDFLIDPIQVSEARAGGADAVLLIAAALDDVCLRELLASAQEHGVDALVEVHTDEELERARGCGAEIVGINNRDLHSFHTDVAVTRRLLPRARGCTIISESGLDDPDVLRTLEEEGVHAFLVGEALMRQGDPGEALLKLRRAT